VSTVASSTTFVGDHTSGLVEYVSINNPNVFGDIQGQPFPPQQSFVGPGDPDVERTDLLLKLYKLANILCDLKAPGKDKVEAIQEMQKLVVESESIIERIEIQKEHYKEIAAAQDMARQQLADWYASRQFQPSQIDQMMGTVTTSGTSEMSTMGNNSLYQGMMGGYSYGTTAVQAGVIQLWERSIDQEVKQKDPLWKRAMDAYTNGIKKGKKKKNER